VLSQNSAPLPNPPGCGEGPELAPRSLGDPFHPPMPTPHEAEKQVRHFLDTWGPKGHALRSPTTGAEWAGVQGSGLEAEEAPSSPAYRARGGGQAPLDVQP
jgi:hypothetical protein